MKLQPALIAILAVTACGTVDHTSTSKEPDPGPRSSMDLGAFSVSLSVKDLAASRAFYEKLGFTQKAGDPSQNWLILGNGTTTIGLFQGMFERNLMTFNPGWTSDMATLEDFTDVRELQARLKAQGIAMATEVDASTTGPGSFMLIDPDGNPILVDQHVGR